MHSYQFVIGMSSYMAQIVQKDLDRGTARHYYIYDSPAGGWGTIDVLEHPQVLAMKMISVG